MHIYCSQRLLIENSLELSPANGIGWPKFIENEFVSCMRLESDGVLGCNKSSLTVDLIERTTLPLY